VFLIRRDAAREAEIEALARYVDGRAFDADTARLSEPLRRTVDALRAPGRQYGALRALASLSFAVAVIVVGLVYDRAGYAGAPVVSLIASTAVLLIVRRVPDQTRDPAARLIARDHGGSAAAGRFGSVSRAFAVQPRLLIVLATLTLAYAGVQGAVTFVGIRIAELGGQPSAVALSYGVSALTEIPGLVITGWLVRRFGLRDGRVETLHEVGTGLGLSRERVRQIETCALEKLRGGDVRAFLAAYRDPGAASCPARRRRAG